MPKHSSCLATIRGLTQQLNTVTGLLESWESQRDRAYKHNEELKDKIQELHNEIEDLRTETKDLEDDLDRWIKMIAYAGIEFEDERVSYVSAQIDREDWLAAKSYVSAQIDRQESKRSKPDERP